MHRAHGSGFRAFQGQMIRNGHKPTICVMLFMVEVLVVSVATDNTGLLDIYKYLYQDFQSVCTA